MAWKNWREALRRGPGHRGKAEIVSQGTYEWEFVELTSRGRGQYMMTTWTQPGKPRRGAEMKYNLSLISLAEAIARCGEMNRQLAEAYIRRQKRQALEKHRQESQQRGSGHRPGAMKDCPACQEAADEQRQRARERKRQREQGGDGDD